MTQMEPTSENLDDILKKLLAAIPEVKAAAIVSAEGLPIASAPMRPDHELASAMIAMLQQVSVETQDHLELAPVDEVTIRTKESMHLVCRTIPSGKDWICLCALVPPGQVYRRATNRAVRRIRDAIEG